MNQEMLVIRLAQAAVTLGEPLGEARTEGYVGELSDLDPGLCIEALGRLMREDGRRFLPSPGEIREAVHGVARDRQMRTPLLEAPPLTDAERAEGIAHIEAFKRRMGWDEHSSGVDNESAYRRL